MRIAALLLGTVVLLVSARADAHPVPTIPWILVQTVPSPELAFAREGARSFGMRWQVTPFLWSFGIHRRAPARTRFFVVEPPMRHAGSYELFFAPEWLAPGADGRFVAHAGLRGWFPIADRGESLAATITTGAYRDGSQVGPELALGLHVLYGTLGVELAHAPRLRGAEWIFALKVRVL